jgi:uncharacterized membrane protein YbhN (UPF0104 family)
VRKHRGKALLGLAVTAVFLWWTLRDVSLSHAWDQALAADPWWMAASVLVATLVFVPRAMRWKVLLKPTGRAGSFDSRFGGVCIGAMANNLLPVRLGEFARAFAFSRVEPVGVSAAFGSVVAERVFDGLVLAGFLAVALAVPGSPLADGNGADLVRRLAVGGGLVFGIAGLGLWGVVRWPRKALGWFEATLGRLLSPDLTDRGLDLLASFIDGLGALHQPAVFFRTLTWTVVVWIVHAVSIWLGLLAFEITAPGFSGALFVQALIGFAVAIPSSPGFFGPFEAATRFGLGVYGVEVVSAVSFAGAYHVLTFLPVTLIGVWYAHRIGLRWAELQQSEEIVGAAVGDMGSGRGSAALSEVATASTSEAGTDGASGMGRPSAGGRPDGGDGDV